MILFPAIDLKGGNCVRLIKGDMNESTVFNTSPGGQATIFQSAGCEWLHVVDSVSYTHLTLPTKA